MTSIPTAPSVRARPSRPLALKTLLPFPSSGELAEFRRLSLKTARISSGNGMGVDRETPSKRQRVDTYPAAVVGRETYASHVAAFFVGWLLRDEAYSVVKSKASELSLFFDHMIGDYDEDVRSRDIELSAAKEAYAKVKKDCDDKLTKLKLRFTKAEGKIVQLRGELSSSSDLQGTKIGEAVAEGRDKMARGFAERTNEVVGLLAKIGGKVQNDMLNLAEIDANLEFIGLPSEVQVLCERRHPIYDAHDVFADLLASVRRVLEIPVVYAGAAEACVTIDDDVEVTDKEDVEVSDDDEDAED
ncbi:hypothetical protein AALP_AA7G093200 [Arabis alpina]|nr:hypothetical protein AALP_AA7G093200 [Arabis alpina]